MHTYLHVCVCMHVRIHVYMYILGIEIFINGNIYTCVYVYACMCVYDCICICAMYYVQCAVYSVLYMHT